MRGNRHYVHLATMTALSFISLYILMYAMVNRFANVYSNLNQFYMAGLMTAPIVVRPSFCSETSSNGLVEFASIPTRRNPDVKRDDTHPPPKGRRCRDQTTCQG